MEVSNDKVRINPRDVIKHLGIITKESRQLSRLLEGKTREMQLAELESLFPGPFNGYLQSKNVGNQRIDTPLKE